MRRSLYTSPVDHGNLGDWPSLARRLARAAQRACEADARVEVGDEPVFGYGPDGGPMPPSDLEETLLGLEEPDLGPRTVRIDLWSVVAHHGAICVAVGDGLVRKERRALEKAVRKVLRGEAQIYEAEGPFDRDACRVYGYRLDPGDDRDRATLAFQTMLFDPRVYVAERWLLQGDDESIDESEYRVWPKTPSRHVRFSAETEEAEERVWHRAALGQGVFVVGADDPDLDRLPGALGRTGDLRHFAAESREHRLTLGRGRPEDHLAVVYNPHAPPDEDAPWLFAL